MGMKLTDGRTTVEINMYVWDGYDYGEDLSRELLQDIEHKEVILGIYMVHNIDDILEYTSMWQSEDYNNVVELKHIYSYVVLYDYLDDPDDGDTLVSKKAEFKGTMLELLMYIRELKIEYGHTFSYCAYAK